MTAERFTLDTNILVYAVDRDAGERHVVAAHIIRLARRCDCVMTLQAIGEFFWAATRKRRASASHAAAYAQDLLEVFPCVGASATAVRSAMAAASLGRASYWDALLVATAAEGGCSSVITEDLADGASISGMRVVNPFAAEGLSAAAAALLT